MSDPVLERFHRALIEEIQTQRPEYLTAPFTVAEIYQNLVPYGSHRDRIGVEMNGDYEDALIRLLAGEGGYLILDSEPALRDLRAELESPNPNTGLYREFAAVDVRLNQAYLDLSAAAIDELPDLARELEAEDPVTMAELAPGAMSGDLGIVPPGVDIFSEAPPEDVTEMVPVTPMVPVTVDTPAAPAAAPVASSRPPLAPEFVEPVEPEPETQLEPEPEVAASSGGSPCQWCNERLPEREGLNFCPYCGTDLSLVPCPACGAEVEPGWRYCVSCGAAAPT